MADRAPSYYEFFAGGGMARAGLGPGWKCLFANDFDPMKVATYAANWGADHLTRQDVAAVRAPDLPGRADLAWASFPCQDLSLAGDGRGLGAAGAGARTRSGTFWPFWSLMTALGKEGRAPRMIVLENVIGMLTSRGGEDFAAVCAALAGAGYRFGALVIDAALFVPQSRPRLFFIAVESRQEVPGGLQSQSPLPQWTSRALRAAHRRLSPAAQRDWLWWAPSPPATRDNSLADILEEEPVGVRWRTQEETDHLVSLMSSLNRARLEQAKASGGREIGTVYRRTRPAAGGGKQQRAEVRFDGVAGCLRTPRGGSSRQTILVVHGPQVRSRLLSPREAARLMGLAEDYALPSRYNDAYHVAGDGVCAPVVRHIAETLLEPVLACLSRPVTLNTAA